MMYCTRCGHVGEPAIEEESRFSVGWCIFLLLLGILPGLIYLIAAPGADRFWVCTTCKGRSCLVPMDSPVAVQALRNAGAPVNLPVAPHTLAPVSTGQAIPAQTPTPAPNVPAMRGGMLALKGFLISLVLVVIADAATKMGSARDVGVSIALLIGAVYIIVYLLKWRREKKFIRGKAIAWTVVSVFLLACLAGISGRGGAGSNREAVGNRQTQESSLTEADQLIKNCGKPLKDDSTAYDSPRPPIVTRFVDYKVNGVRLKFIYVPGNGHVGDPPPYDWKLQMVANAKTNKLYDRDQMSKLMWCTASLPGPRLVAGQSPRTDTTN